MSDMPDIKKHGEELQPPESQSRKGKKIINQDLEDNPDIFDGNDIDILSTTPQTDDGEGTQKPNLQQESINRQPIWDINRMSKSQPGEQ